MWWHHSSRLWRSSLPTPSPHQTLMHLFHTCSRWWMKAVLVPCSSLPGVFRGSLVRCRTGRLIHYTSEVGEESVFSPDITGNPCHLQSITGLGIRDFTAPFPYSQMKHLWDRKTNFSPYLQPQPFFTGWYEKRPGSEHPSFSLPLLEPPHMPWHPLQANPCPKIHFVLFSLPW